MQITTMVRMKVARSELTFSTPTFAKIAVSAANTADSTAQNCQDENALEFMAPGPLLRSLPYPIQNFMTKINASTSTAGLASANFPAISFASA